VGSVLHVLTLIPLVFFNHDAMADAPVIARVETIL
jgi:hypothetical protein